jgi:hypothetical protein
MATVRRSSKRRFITINGHLTDEKVTFGAKFEESGLQTVFAKSQVLRQHAQGR